MREPRRTLPIELWIDPICPWCLIAITRLTRAADRLDLALDLRLRAFRLHPDWPAEGMAWRDFQTCRNLPDAVFDHVAHVGHGDGLRFDFGHVARVPDTTNLHRILAAAGHARLAMAVYRAFADAYFFAGIDLSTNDQVIAAAVRGGMDAAAAQAAVGDPETLAAIGADEVEARQLGVRGVPFLRIGDSMIAGAQPASFYTGLMQRAALPLGTG